MQLKTRRHACMVAPFRAQNDFSHLGLTMCRPWRGGHAMFHGTLNQVYNSLSFLGNTGCCSPHPPLNFYDFLIVKFLFMLLIKLHERFGIPRRLDHGGFLNLGDGILFESLLRVPPQCLCLRTHWRHPS